VIGITTTMSRSIYVDDLPLSPWVQIQQQETQQVQKMLLVRPSLRPRLLVGPGQFGGKVGLLDTLRPPELIKYLTVSEWGSKKGRNVSSTCQNYITFPPSHLFILIYTNIH
jgi:hypothetical protein